MAAPNDFIKAERVVAAAIGLLEREVVLPNLMWRNAVGDFAGAKNDTITVRLPSYVAANRRDLRSGGARSKTYLHERSVDMTLDEDIYLDVPITDEQLTLDIVSFAQQVLSPGLAAIVRAYEDVAAELITGATYQNAIEFDETDPYASFITARRLLNEMNVPMQDRFCVVGSTIEAQLLQDDRLATTAVQGGDQSALRDAVVGRYAGVNVVSSNALPPDGAVMFHRSAFALANRAPIVPAGAPWGATQSAGGFAIRIVRVFDPDEVEDRVVFDAWVGSNVVTDFGTIDADGKFVPGDDQGDPQGSEDDIFVRAVGLGVIGGAES